MYFIRSKFSHIDLVERAKVLRRLIGDRIDAEIIRAAFRCTIEEAESALCDIK